MIALDTNVPLRSLAQDDPVQSIQAAEIIERHLSARNSGFVSLLCILEMARVLGSLYKRKRG